MARTSQTLGGASSAAPLLALGVLLATMVVQISASAASTKKDEAFGGLPAAALGADDACSAEALKSGSCAVSALQQKSARGFADHSLIAGDNVLETAAHLSPRERSDAESHLVLDSQRLSDFPAELGDDVDKKWVWPRDMAYRQLHTTNQIVESFSSLYKLSTPVFLGECEYYNAYFWPQFSFWSQEVIRRVEALPKTPPPEKQKDLQQFVRNAGYLMCLPWQDPRKGTNFTEHVIEHMRQVKEAPSTSLEMPRLPKWFSTILQAQLYVHDSCIFWTSSLMCDLGYTAKDLTGNKKFKGNDICWDKVQIPDYGYSMEGMPLQFDRKGVKRSEAELDHPEYLTCQEKPLTKELLKHYCPYFGHYPDGLLNVSSWGHGAPKGSRMYNDVLQCQAKIGIPNVTHCSEWMVHRPDEGVWIDMMRPSQGPFLDYTDTIYASGNLTVLAAGALARRVAEATAKQALKVPKDASVTGFQAAAVSAAGQAAQVAAQKAMKKELFKAYDKIDWVPFTTSELPKGA